MKKQTQMPEQPAATVAQLLTIDQVAARLHVHRTTIYGFINRDRLPVTRLGTHAVRVDESDLKVWLNQRKAQAS